MSVDSVANALATPEREQPFGALGLKQDEYDQIRVLLGRRPTSGELAMYSVMWSEHCSYKSSKIHLRQFGQKVTPEMTKNLLVGMGENAGVVDIGEGWAVTFKIESHNHPSFIEPFQGAATGVGGIVRDIISMGARPVAVMDALRFGALNHPDTARVAHGCHMVDVHAEPQSGHGFPFQAKDVISSTVQAWPATPCGAVSDRPR